MSKISYYNNINNQLYWFSSQVPTLFTGDNFNNILNIEIAPGKMAINLVDNRIWYAHNTGVTEIITSYNISSYVSGGTGATSLSGLTDVTITSPTNGQTLQYNGSIWVNGTGASGVYSIENEIKHKLGLDLLSKEFIYTGNTIERIDYYDTSGGTIDYTKDLNYSSGKVISTVYTRLSDSATETLTYVYLGNKIINTNYS